MSRSSSSNLGASNEDRRLDPAFSPRGRWTRHRSIRTIPPLIHSLVVGIFQLSRRKLGFVLPAAEAVEATQCSDVGHNVHLRVDVTKPVVLIQGLPAVLVLELREREIDDVGMDRVAVGLVDDVQFDDIEHSPHSRAFVRTSNRSLTTSRGDLCFSPVQGTCVGSDAGPASTLWERAVTICRGFPLARAALRVEARGR